VEPLELDVSRAVPVGFILNETVTKSTKYAFPNERTGIISISVSEISPGQHLLVISDTGVGIPDQLKHKTTGSLGMRLMEGLSEDLDGKFSIETRNGTSVKISFARDAGVKRPDVPAESFLSGN
jgi:two-component sensor histidine kinase